MDKYFICINFCFDSELLIKSPTFDQNLESLSQAIFDCDVHLGFLQKKSLCGKKAYLKTLGEEGLKLI